MISLYFQGLAMGLAYVAPIGMQNMYVINSALTLRRRKAVLVAWIVIFFDIALAIACFLGVGALMALWEPLEYVVLFAGSLLVIFIGISLIRSKPPEDGESKDVDVPLWKTAWVAFVVTWFNPQAILDGTMLLGASRASIAGDGAWAFLIGVNSASIIWFLGLALFFSIFSSKFTPKIISVINIICGIVIIIYGIKLFVTFIMKLLPLL